MGSEIQVHGSQTALSIDGLDRERLDLLKRTVAKGTTDDEFKMFVHVCGIRKVDPFSKMLYPVKRWDSKENCYVMAVQSSIDYFRLTAERNGKYAGQIGPQWCGTDGVWKDVWLSKDAPAAARVGILRSDFKEPLYAVALWSNYVQTTKQGDPTKFWSSMGPLMLGKCAESLAIRRAFPEDLAGLYTPEEMAQAEVVDEAPQAAQRTPPPKTLQEAAGRARAKPEPQAIRVVDVQPVPAQGAVDDPRPVDADTGVPALEPVSGLGYRYAGVIIPANVADAPARWMHYKIETKVQAINGKLWSDMPLGEIGGGRHSWLVNVVKWGADLSAKGETVPLLVARAAYCLFLIEKAAYDAAESAKRESEWVAAGGPPSDDPNAEDTGTPFT